jgi:hypothetical protein
MDATELQFRPEPVKFYKPQKNGKGAALSVQLRLTPEFASSYVKAVAGGLFLEFAAQTGTDPKGNATFDWPNSLTAKLGRPDIGSLLLGLKHVRDLGKPTPAMVRHKDDQAGVTVSLFHKFDTHTTAILWTFEADGSFLQLSRSATERSRIKLSLVEEYEFGTVLQHALTQFHLLGKR